MDVIFSLYAVMLMGSLVYRIRYTFPEYVCTLLVAGGVSMFALTKILFLSMSALPGYWGVFMFALAKTPDSSYPTTPIASSSYSKDHRQPTTADHSPTAAHLPWCPPTASAHHRHSTTTTTTPPLPLHHRNSTISHSARHLTQESSSPPPPSPPPPRLSPRHCSTARSGGASKKKPRSPGCLRLLSPPTPLTGAPRSASRLHPDHLLPIRVEPRSFGV
ncbi:UDP-galactose/UDP-glucose transporter 3 [Camellia lanceoleosa]|uniref:UDP-galactose/UDP-glucose transporter 3 n=1 Tax=Camellia lanceoleosa TaxID=1840588 RepID=A0ACC0GE58_9ERIC|nr:UDP-galactose/UDP-glucose transporter 3 [Camellia lanceoleosa]